MSTPSSRRPRRAAPSRGPLHDPAGPARAAPRRHAARAALRPVLRRGHRPGWPRGCTTASARATSAHALLGYGMVFFAIWWAWMNFTWFASAYDVDDVPYRLTMLSRSPACSCSPPGVPARLRATATSRSSRSATSIMRVGHGRPVAARRARRPARRGPPCAIALGIRVCQVGWLCACSPAARSCGSSASSCWRRASSSCPIWAERAGRDPVAPAPHRRALRPVHADRARRVGARRDAWRSRPPSRPASYTLRLPAAHRGRAAHPVRDVVDLLRRAAARRSSASAVLAFAWGYGHSAGLRLRGGRGGRHRRRRRRSRRARAIPSWGVGLSVGIPAALYVLCVCVIHIRPHQGGRRHLIPAS